MAETSISESDFRILKRLITQKNNRDCASLGQEITRARIVKDEKISSDIVRLNSQVEVLDITGNHKLQLRIVMPDEADIRKRNISVFAPISVVLLGQKENDLITWQTNGSERQLKVLRVHNNQGQGSSDPG